MPPFSRDSHLCFLHNVRLTLDVRFFVQANKLDRDWRTFAAALDDRSTVLAMSTIFHKRTEEVRTSDLHGHLCFTATRSHSTRSSGLFQI